MPDLRVAVDVGGTFTDICVLDEEQGTIWELRYPLTDGSGSLVVATTRPETMLGDTAVAVNPRNNHIFVALPPNNVFAAPANDRAANCLEGCIAVFAASGDGD